MSERTCEQRIDAELAKVKADIKLYLNDADVYEEGSQERNLPPFHEYGLDFEYIEPGTFEWQECGYYSYMLSYGGPSDQIRFFPNGKIEYWFMDWFDGACRDITKEEWARQLRDIFEEMEAINWKTVQLY
jgi:hypothetical protein